MEATHILAHCRLSVFQTPGAIDLAEAWVMIHVSPGNHGQTDRFGHAMPSQTLGLEILEKAKAPWLRMVNGAGI